MPAGKVYEVVNPETGGVLNRVEHAELERDTDGQEVKNRKRREEAERKMYSWSETVYAGRSLELRVSESYG